jgi:hypothetical protein
MLADLLAVRRRTLLQQVLRRDQHSGRTEAALQRVARVKGGLQIGDLAAVGQSFNGLDGSVVRLHRQHQTGTHDIPVHPHRACAAHPVLAAHMGSGQLEILAQEVRQIETRQNVGANTLPVDVERYLHRRSHPRSPAARTGRPSSAATQRASSTFARCRRMDELAC